MLNLFHMKASLTWRRVTLWMVYVGCQIHQSDGQTDSYWPNGKCRLKLRCSQNDLRGKVDCIQSCPCRKDHVWASSASCLLPAPGQSIPDSIPQRTAAWATFPHRDLGRLDFQRLCIEGCEQGCAHQCFPSVYKGYSPALESGKPCSDTVWIVVVRTKCAT